MAGDILWQTTQLNKHYLDGYKESYTNKYFQVYDLVKNDKLKTVETIQPTETMKKLQTSPTETSCDYTIQVGDSLWRIAKNKLGKGSYSTKIIELNKDTYFDLPTIHPGRKIVIPCT